MRKDKENAINLRRFGKSYNEIKAELGVPKSTLSDWFKDQKWSNDLAKNLAEKVKEQSKIRLIKLDKIRGEHLKKLYREAEIEAEAEFKKLKYHPLFIAALMIYWGEGNKLSRNRCCVANTEPLMIKIFYQFLKNICGLSTPRIKAWILYYPDLNEKVCKDYWCQNCGLKYEDFNKSIKIIGKHKTRKLSFGVCNLGVSSSYLKHKILRWIDLLAHDLADEKYIAGVV